MEQIGKLLKRDYRLFLAMLLLFFAAILLGEVLHRIDPVQAKNVQKVVLEHFTEIAKKIKGAPVYKQIHAIWLNNVIASISAIFLGIIFPLIPLGILTGNGLIIGVFQQYTAATAHLKMLDFYLAMIPHGIFEIPAFLMAVGLGFRLGLIPYRWFWHYYKTKEHLPLFKEFFKDLRYYAVLIIVLLTVAAMVEITVSPYIMQLFKYTTKLS